MGFFSFLVHELGHPTSLDRGTSGVIYADQLVHTIQNYLFCLPAAQLWHSSGLQMARGNQRELARQKNLKKQQQQKSKRDGDPVKNKENDAAILREKQAKGK